MNQRKRILIAVVILVGIVGIVLGVEYFLRRGAASQAPANMPVGAIPIFLDGKFVASFVPADLDRMERASFVDAEESKMQEGWLLRDVLLLYVSASDLTADSQITVSSSSREKSHTLTWAEVESPENMVMFDLSGRGTLKLVSRIPGFDVRDAWIQDVDRIEVVRP